jgi:hypothetical protein
LVPGIQIGVDAKTGTKKVIILHCPKGTIDFLCRPEILC